MKRQYAPIALFAYNRPKHLRKTIEALLCNHESTETDLFVYSDGAKNEAAIPFVEEVRQYLRTLVGFLSVTIIERQENMGLGKSIIDGVSEVCKTNGRVIVLEDDLVCAPFFLKYMNDALDTYKDDLSVASILGYALPLKIKLPETYFVRGADCLGWATWSRAWDLFEEDSSILLAELIRTQQSIALDLNGVMGYTQMLRDQIDGKNNSWAVRWHVSMYLKNMLTLTPSQSLICHIGNDGSGENFGFESFLDTPLCKREIKIERIDIEENSIAPIATERYFLVYKSLWSRVKRRLLRIIR